MGIFARGISADEGQSGIFARSALSPVFKELPNEARPPLQPSFGVHLCAWAGEASVGLALLTPRLL